MPVLMPRSLSSSVKRFALALHCATRSGCARICCVAASAAAAFGGLMPTEYTKPGVVYLRYSTSAWLPAM